MRKLFILIAVILTVGALFLFAQRDRGLAQGNEAKIANAMSAAPASIAKDATIMDWAPSGQHPPVLRQGTNGWTCFPDMPGIPGHNSMCLDKMWMEWLRAFSTQTKPNITAPGIAYMLQGGGTGSMTDPSKFVMVSKDQWIAFPPHIMLLQPAKFDPTLYATEFKGKAGPWLVGAGTPYEHLIVPVVDPTQSSN